MQRIRSRVTGLLNRRSAIAALAAFTVGGTAAALLAAEPTMKPKSRTTAPTASPVAGPARTHGALASAPPSVAPDPAPSWFPAGPERDKECEDLRKLLREHGDKDGNGCISEAEAHKLFEEIQREWEGVRPGMFIRGSYWFDKWLFGKGYLRNDQLRRIEIVVSIWKRFVFNRDGLMSFEDFKKFLQSLGLMCSSTPTIPSGGGSGGGVMLPELPY